MIRDRRGERLSEEQQELMDWLSHQPLPDIAKHEIEVIADAYWQQLGYRPLGSWNAHLGPRFTGGR